jgi:type III pantothenate kinase
LNLVVDIGNTRLKWAMGEVDAPWQAQGDLVVDRDLEAVLEAAWRTLPRPGQVVVGSVAGRRAEAAVRRQVRQRWQLEPHMVRARKEQLGLINRYERPAQLGADRWAAMIGARLRRQGALCVVDAGSAVTIEGVTAAGEFIGGVILPGLSMSRRALVRGASAIRDADDAQLDVRGRSTARAVGSGTLFGLAGGIDRVIEELGPHLGERFTVCLTGGDARRLAPLLRHPVALEPDLVLRGLAAIAGQLP